MKISMPILTEVEISFVHISVAVRYEEEDIPNDFPLRTGDMWNATVAIDNGQIQNWPVGQSGKMHMKVTDCGSYALLNHANEPIAEIENDYVPNGVVPGEYGDYIILDIDSNGVITNWPKRPDVSAFFPTGD